MTDCVYNVLAVEGPDIEKQRAFNEAFRHMKHRMNSASPKAQIMAITEA